MGYADFGKRWQHMITSTEDGLKKGLSAEKIMTSLKKPGELFDHKAPDGSDWLRVNTWLTNSKAETEIVLGWLRHEISVREQKLAVIEELLPLVGPLVEVEPIHMY